MPVLETSGFDQQFNDVASRSLLELIKYIGPVEINNIGVDGFQRDKVEEIWPRYFTLVGLTPDRMVKVVDFKDSFLNDLK